MRDLRTCKTAWPTSKPTSSSGRPWPEVACCWCEVGPLLAATSLGLAAACKCTGPALGTVSPLAGPALAAAWIVVVALGVNLLPDLVQPHADRTPVAG